MISIWVRPPPSWLSAENELAAAITGALARLGHEVHLLCQDRRAGELDWVGRGVTVHVPDIGGLRPVYVADRYEGFRVKTFPELTDDELDVIAGKRANLLQYIGVCFVAYLYSLLAMT